MVLLWINEVVIKGEFRALDIEETKYCCIDLYCVINWQFLIVLSLEWSESQMEQM